MKQTLRILCCLVLASTMAGAAAARQDPGAAPAVLLLEAKRIFDALDYERAVTVLDRLVSLLEERPALPSVDNAQRQQLVEAYELRARSRFGLNDREGSRADFKSLLTLNPGHTMTGQVSPNVVAIFNEIKAALVGTLNLTLSPPDAELQIDGVTVRAPAGSMPGPMPIVAGEHTISARQTGYRAASQAISIAAGAVVDLVLALERVSATINLITVPSEVEVVVDGVSRGTTLPGPPPDEYAEAVRSLGVPPATASRPFLIADVSTGTHVIELRKSCYVPSQQRVEVQKPSDYRLAPVRLVSAVGVLTITSSPSGSVFVDGESRGATPIAAAEVCEGAHVVEVRSPYGRDLRRLNVRTGDRVSIAANMRPAVALLSTAGLPEGLRGGPDLRLTLEQLMQDARSFMLFAPPAEQVDQALAREKLAPAWLSFDRARRPVGDAAANVAAPARRELSAQFAKTFDVQAIAAVTVPAKDDRSDVLLTLLAAGSGEPDIIRVKLDDPESVHRAVTALDYSPALFRTSAGLHVADVHDVAGAVVVRVEPGSAAQVAGLVPGDVIIRVGGENVQDGSRFSALLASAKVDDQMTIEVRDRADVVKRVPLALGRVPQVVAMSDETLLFNKLLLDFRRQLISPAGALDESVARLNLAVVLMRVGGWTEARAELEKVQLPDRPGVAAGTVHYLIGLCREALGQLTEAESAWKTAAAAKDALLTADGPLIKDLAERKLADLARRLRR
jgi:hypothetical protein